MTHLRTKSQRGRKFEPFGRGSGGFTLVELMVVIGIIAVLMGLLLPVLSKARESSRRTTCLSNLRTLVQAMHLYADDNRDMLPNDTASQTYQPDDASVLVYFAGKYVGKPKVFYCPSSRGGAPSAIDNGYSGEVNSARFSYEFLPIWWPSDQGPALTQFKGETPLTWDNDGGDDKSGIGNHEHGGNVGYADGHAEWQRVDLWDGASWPHPAKDYLPPR